MTHAAAARLLDEHAAAMQRYAILLTGNRDDAQDLVQQACEKILRAPHLVDAAEQPQAYVKRILTNMYLNGHRRTALARRVLPLLVARVPRTASPTDELAERDELWRALQRLPKRQCAALVLRYYEDLNFADIAEILGCPPTTARSLVLLRPPEAASDHPRDQRVGVTMRTNIHTEEDLRATLRRAAEIATDPSSENAFGADRRPRTLRRVAPLVAAAGVIAVLAIPTVLLGSRHDQPRDVGSSATPTSAASTSSPPASTEQRISLQDVSDLGYPFKTPGLDAQPRISESQALEIAHGDLRLGLLLVGINHYDNPEQDSTSKITTEWRLTWIIGGPPRDVPVLSSKVVGSEPKIKTVHDVYFVDALTGEIFRSFTL